MNIWCIYIYIMHECIWMRESKIGGKSHVLIRKTDANAIWQWVPIFAERFAIARLDDWRLCNWHVYKCWWCWKFPCFPTSLRPLVLSSLISHPCEREAFETDRSRVRLLEVATIFGRSKIGGTVTDKTEGFGPQNINIRPSKRTDRKLALRPQKTSLKLAIWDTKHDTCRKGSGSTNGRWLIWLTSLWTMDWISGHSWWMLD